MAADALWPIQEALYDRLSALPELAGMVYAEGAVPAGAPFPRVTIGSLNGTPADDKIGNGLDATINIDTWARGNRGVKDAAELQAVIYAALHRQPLAVAGHNTLMVIREFIAVFIDEDGLTMHGTARFRVLTEDI